MSNINMEDSSLLQLLQENPEQGIYALQSCYGGMIFRIVSRILPEYPQDTEEIASDVLVAVWRNAAMLAKNDRLLGPWLTVTARNKAIDRRRLLTRRNTVPLNEELDFPSEAWPTEGEDLISTLVANLGEPDREIFLRRYYRMETAQEIGEAMKMQAHTVNARLSRGRAKLKSEYLKQMGKETGRYAKSQGIS